MKKVKTSLNETSLNNIRKKMKMLYEYTYFNKEQLTEDDEETQEVEDTEDTEVSDDKEIVEPQENDGLTEPVETDSEEQFDGGEDEMINIDDLTNSQKNTESMVGDVSGKLNNLIQLVQNFSDTVDNLQKQNQDLYRELEKRVPTNTEKLNLRVLNSYPYDVDLKGYWSDVEKEGRYRAYPDNQKDEEDEVEYVITLDDLNDIGSNLKY